MARVWERVIFGTRDLPAAVIANATPSIRLEIPQTLTLVAVAARCREREIDLTSELSVWPESELTFPQRHLSMPLNVAASQRSSPLPRAFPPVR